ncbi:MAG: hypothetical protein ACAH59_05715, partial [Pseudobdellovibrionaceae bacterium]
MKKVFMRPWILGALLFGFSSASYGQMYGTGMMGGMMGCPYQQQVGDDAENIQDDINERREALRDVEADIREAKSKERELQRKMDRARGDLERRGFASEYLEKIIDHITEGRKCSEYVGGVSSPVTPAPETRRPQSEEEAPALASVQGGKPNETTPFTASDWFKLCDQTKKGRVLSGACKIESAQVPKPGFNLSSCTTNIQTYQDSKEKLDQAKAKLEALNARKDALKAEIAALRGDYKQAVRDHQKELREQATEGGCIDCMIQGSGYYSQKPKTDWGGVVTNLGLGIASMYLGNNMQEHVASQNARLGVPTQVYPSFGYGYPFIMGAVGAALGGGAGGGFYGSIGGGMGAGGFGCANGMGGNGYGGMVGGPFGYPPGFFQTPYGGGMYTGYPMGMVAGGGFGFMMGGMGAMGGMMPMMGGMGAMGGMMPMMGGMGAMGGMMPMMGGMGAMGGMMPMMGGMGAMGGMMPMMGGMGAMGGMMPMMGGMGAMG